MILRVLLIGLVVIALGGFGVVAFVALRPAPPAETVAEAAVARVAVLAASKALRPGTLLKPDDLAVLTVEAPLVPAAARRDSPAFRAELIGSMIRRAVQPGEILLQDDVMRPGDHGFLAAVLGPDMRAVTVGVDAVSGTAGLIWPGDRVDMILTHTIDDATAPLARRVAGETVLSDVRVIAIDQQIMQGSTESLGLLGNIGPTARTVTLEVNAREAERIAVAVRLGRLSLSVRSALRPNSAAEAAAADAAPLVTYGGDVSAALRNSGRGGGQPSSIRVFLGPGRSEEYRY